jgi:hypothetical protein
MKYTQKKIKPKKEEIQRDKKYTIFQAELKKNAKKIFVLRDGCLKHLNIDISTKKTTFFIL